jgi:general secretion pathway protein F
MAKFRYRACGLDGGFAEGAIDAGSIEAAKNALWSQGLTPFQVRAESEAGTRWWQREISFGTKSKTANLAAFTRELATLNAADIPLDDALRILCDQASSASLRALVASLRADVLNGMMLSDAMEKQSLIFPADYVNMVRAGEVGGTVDQVFIELADLLERRLEIHARVKSALIYPCILIALSLVTLAIIATALIPSIAPIFAEGGKPVPFAIQLILSVYARWVEIFVALALFASATMAIWSIIGRKASVRMALDRHKTKVPVVGPFLSQQEAARFARTFGTMLRAGVPLLQAAKSGRAVIRNRYVAAGMDRAIEAVHQGVALHLALQKETEFPSVALQMISVGEEAGKLERMVMRVAIMLERQSQTSIDRFMAALTPALTVSIAVMIGALILPLMNAVLSINDLAAR